MTISEVAKKIAELYNGKCKVVQPFKYSYGTPYGELKIEGLEHPVSASLEGYDFEVDLIFNGAFKQVDLSTILAYIESPNYTIMTDGLNVIVSERGFGVLLAEIEKLTFNDLTPEIEEELTAMANRIKQIRKA